MANGASALDITAALANLLQGREPQRFIYQQPSPRTLPPNPTPGNVERLPIFGSPLPGNYIPAPTPPPSITPAPSDSGAQLFNFEAASQPLDQSIIDQVRALAGIPPPAYVPPRQTFLQGLTQALQRGVSAGLTRDPGATLLGLSQQEKAEEIRARERAEERQGRFQERQGQFGLAGIQLAESVEARRQAAAQRRADRQFELEDRKLEREVQRLARLEGFTHQEDIEKLRAALQAKQDRERERAADERLLQQQRLRFSEQLAEQIKFYKGQGVGDQQQARRLALNDYSDIATQLGIKVPSLTQADNNTLGKVQAQIDRLQRLASSGGGGGGRGGGSGADKIQTWVELSSGDIVPADKVNFDRLPVGVTVRRMFSTVGVGGQELKAGGATSLTLEEAQRQLGVMRNASKSAAEINAAIEAMIKDNPKLKGELEKLRVGAAPPREFKAPVFADPEGSVFGISGSGGAASSQEEIRKRVGVGVMKSDVDWLRNQLDYAEKQLQIAPGIVQREALQKQVNDLRSRLTYAEGKLKEGEGKANPFGYIQR